MTELLPPTRQMQVIGVPGHTSLSLLIHERAGDPTTSLLAREAAVVHDDSI